MAKNNGQVSGLGSLALTMSSASPIMFIISFAQHLSENSKDWISTVFLLSGLFFAVSAVLIIYHMNKNVDGQPLRINKIESLDGEESGYFLGLMLTVVSINLNGLSECQFIFTLVLMVLCSLRMRLHRYNLILSIFGYRMYKFESGSSVEVILTKSGRPTVESIKTAVRVTEHLWLDTSKEG